MASNYKVILALYGRYLATDFDYDGNWQAVISSSFDVFDSSKAPSFYTN